MNEKTDLAGGEVRNWSFDHDNAPYLIGTQCTDCGQFHFPAIPNCSKCLSDQLKEVRFGREGTLYSYSIIYVPPLGFKAPYAIGYVDLDEGLRLFSMITDWQEGQLKNGDEMELVITKIREDLDGNDVKGYAYRPKR